jgi:hypothetical protein
VVTLQTLAMLWTGALAGYFVGPWLAAANGRIRWWEPLVFYVAVGTPARWLAWVTGAAWVESGFDPDAVGDNGKSVGVLQYNAGAMVRPEDRASPFWSGFAAADYVATAASSTPTSRDSPRPRTDWKVWFGRYVCPWLTLRLPFVGYLGFRWSWRSGAAPCGWRALLDAPRWERERRAALVVWTVLAVAVVAMGVPAVGLPWTVARRRRG